MLLGGIAVGISGWPVLAALFYVASLLLLVVVFIRADLFRVTPKIAWLSLGLSTVCIAVLWVALRPEPQLSMSELAKEMAIALPIASPAPRQMAEPTFVDNVKDVIVKVGSNQMTYRLVNLGTKGVPFNVVATEDEFLPIYISVDKGKLYADVTLSDLNCAPAMTLKRNRITLNKTNWDRNMNENALEVVDDKYDPMFQLIYERPDKLRINGIFCTSTHIIYATDDGSLINRKSDPPENFKLKRIFKYPSWEHASEKN